MLGIDPAHGSLDWKARLGIVLQSSTEPGTATVRGQLAVVMIALGVSLVLPL